MIARTFQLLKAHRCLLVLPFWLSKAALWRRLGEVQKALVTSVSSASKVPAAVAAAQVYAAAAAAVLTTAVDGVSTMALVLADVSVLEFRLAPSFSRRRHRFHSAASGERLPMSWTLPSIRP